MNLRQIQDIAGHRDVPPWVVKLVQDCIEHDRTWEREKQQVVSSKMEHTSQEPVGVFANVNALTPEKGTRWEQMVDSAYDGVEYIHLYAAPVSAKREWVDLTDDELRELIRKEHDAYCLVNAYTLKFARAVIAAFKEKNK